MDAYEATRIVFSRIQSIDPENAAKIMGFLLIQDHGDKEMIRLAFGPESLVHTLILKACNELGLSPFFPLSRQSSSRLLRSHSSASADFNVLSPNGNGFHHNVKSNHIDEFHLQDHLSFLEEGPKDPDLFFPSSDTDAMFFNSPTPNWGVNNDQHRRSLSVTDIGSDPFGWKPCLYYARGYCKNGTSCRFLHESPDSTAFGGEFDVMDQCRELLRSRSLKHCQHQQQRLTNASQLLASGSFPYTGSKCSNFLLQQQQNDTLRAAAGLMLDGDDLHHYGRSRIERSDFLSIPGGMANSASRQIYLTFPADSTFREEDVSNYFSIYGPVQDVRIPYQQKRMFGFVTFIYSETVKLILAKGNPHFVCDARVLVKPYKEKGKVPDRKQQQPMMELGDFSPSGITGHDHRDPFDLQLSMQMESSPRMYNTNELLMRRKLEQAELQQAMELHSRKLMGLHLFDGNKHHRRNLSTGTGSVPSPIHSHAYVNQNFMIPTSSPGQSSPMAQLDNCAVSCATSLSLSTIADNVSKPQAELDREGNDAEENSKHGNNNTHVSVEHNLPDNPFASPTKSNADPSGMSFTSAAEVGQSISATLAPSSPSNNSSLISSLVLPATSTLDMASFKSCYLQMPRLSSGNGAIRM